jgi:maltose/moltooligosaccharide transporter
MEWLPMIGVGIKQGQYYLFLTAMLSGSLPANKMGYYMGVFNFFIVIPQLVAASILDFSFNVLNSEPIYALLIGGSAMILAGIIALTMKNQKLQ